MASKIIIDHAAEGTIYGYTRDPDHEWHIRTADTHCYLHVDGELVLHSDMWHCVLYLIGLTD